MRRFALLSACMLFVVGVGLAQNWTRVWKLTTPPYLTRQDINDMAMVKAGFDTDKDGWGEIICTWTDTDSNAICMYEADGNNSYKLVWSWVYPVQSNSFAGIAVGDLNNNGVVDIVTTLPSVVGTDPNPSRLWVFEWNGVVGKNEYGFFNSTNGTYDPSAAWNFNAPDNYDLRPYSLTIEDIDNDGANELITGVRLAGAANREVIVSSVVGDFGGFAVWDVEWKYSQNLGDFNYSTTTGDLDNDGKKEIYMFVWNSFTMRIFECNGDKQYAEVFAVDQFTAPQGIDYGALDAVRVADVNNDGIKEMYIAATEAQNKIFIITGITDVSKMTSADIKVLYTIPVTAGGGLKSMYVADPDHDGKADLMIGGERNGQIFSLEYKGTGNPADSSSWQHQILFDMFKESGLTTISPRLFYGSPAKDMDKDGKDEYAFVNYSPDYADWPDDSPLWLIEVDVAADVKTAPEGVPNDFQLLQNYPNPFNPTTAISYQLPAAGSVRLAVYDMLGREVALLVDGRKEAGRHSVRFNARQLTSGVYFYRLTADGYQDAKRMVLVR
jgi:hypothetical protein